MDLTPVQVKEVQEDGPPADPNAQESAADAEALLGRRVAALVDTTSATVFSYICQVCSPFVSGSCSLRVLLGSRHASVALMTAGQLLHGLWPLLTGWVASTGLTLPEELRAGHPSMCGAVWNLMMPAASSTTDAP